MKYTIIILFLFFFSFVNLKAQDKLPKSEYSKKESVIFTQDFTKITTTSFRIEKDTIYYKEKSTTSEMKMGIDKVAYIRVQEGTKVGTGALLGLLGGIASSLYNTDNEGYPIVFIGLGVLGAGVGALVGAGIPRWKTYHIN